MLSRVCQGIIRRGFATQQIKCWKCQKNVPLEASTTFCSSCNVIQPLSQDVNYFSYLQQDKKFKLDEEALKDKFHKIQSKVHPDKFGGKDENERNLSEKHSSYLNEAYKTLKNPRHRAKYLLELITSQPVEEPTEEDMASNLFEFMSEIEAITEPKAVEEKGAEIGVRVSELMGEVEKCFNSGDNSKAKSLLNKLRYYERAQKILEKKMK